MPCHKCCGSYVGVGAKRPHTVCCQRFLCEVPRAVPGHVRGLFPRQRGLWPDGRRRHAECGLAAVYRSPQPGEGLQGSAKKLDDALHVSQLSRLPVQHLRAQTFTMPTICKRVASGTRNMLLASEARRLGAPSHVRCRALCRYGLGMVSAS